MSHQCSSLPFERRGARGEEERSICAQSKIDRISFARKKCRATDYTDLTRRSKQTRRSDQIQPIASPPRRPDGFRLSQISPWLRLPCMTFCFAVCENLNPFFQGDTSRKNLRNLWLKKRPQALLYCSYDLPDRHPTRQKLLLSERSRFGTSKNS